MVSLVHSFEHFAPSVVVRNLLCSVKCLEIYGSYFSFWLQVGSHKIKLSRGYEASCAAFDR